MYIEEPTCRGTWTEETRRIRGERNILKEIGNSEESEAYLERVTGSIEQRVKS